MKLHKNSLVRQLVLPVFAKVNLGDIRIRHHYTGDPVVLHSFKHRGYWFHGARRERDTMHAFARLIASGDSVIEVGGHIGYVALYLASLVGPSGRVYVFEPGPNNLPYTERNVRTKTNVVVEQCGVGSQCGVLTLHVEELTGQNDSFLSDFEALRSNERSAHVVARKSAVQAPVIDLDTYALGRQLHPRFVKVDVEGYEWEVVQGMLRILNEFRPRLMLEIQRHRFEIFGILARTGYLAFTPTGVPLTDHRDVHLNTFFLHRTDAPGIHAIQSARN